MRSHRQHITTYMPGFSDMGTSESVRTVETHHSSSHSSRGSSLLGGFTNSLPSIGMSSPLSLLSGGAGGMGMMMHPTGAAESSFNSSVVQVRQTMGPDGKVQVERFARSTAGNTADDMVETKEAYMNSGEGVEKVLEEREMHGKGHRKVKEVINGESKEEEEVVNISNEDEAREFDEEWKAKESHLRGGLHHLSASHGIIQTPILLDGGVSHFDGGVSHFPAIAGPQLSTFGTHGVRVRQVPTVTTHISHGGLGSMGLLGTPTMSGGRRVSSSGSRMVTTSSTGWMPVGGTTTVTRSGHSTRRIL